MSEQISFNTGSPITTSLEESGVASAGVIIHEGAPGEDADALQINYSVDGSTLWHETYAEGDLYIRTSVDGGDTWSSAMKFMGEDASPYSLPTASDSVKGGVKVGSGLTMTSETLSANTQTKTHWINIVIDGGGSAIETGIKGDIVLPACTITEVMLLADQSGSIKIDIWKDTYTNYPPTDADSICGGNEPEISSATKDNDATLTDWTTSITAEDILRINVDSCTTIERCTLALKVTI